MSKYIASNLENIQRITLLISIILLVLSILIIIINPQANNFENTVYSGYSTLFWVIFISSILTSSLVLLSYSYEKFKKSYLFLSLFTILILLTLLFTLPYIRGYAFYGRGWEDSISHVGHVKTILETGHISEENWYPVTHILMSNFRIFGINFELSRSIISLFFTVFYISFISLYFGKCLKKSFVIPFFCALPFIYTHLYPSIAPSVLSFLSIPFLLYIIRKSKIGNYKFKILIPVVIFFMTFFHPMTSLVVIIMMIVTIISVYKYNKFFKKNYLINKSHKYVLFSFVASFAIWYTGQYRFSLYLRDVFSKLTAGQGSPIVAQQTSYTRGLTLFQIIVRFIQLYGVIWIYAGIAGVFLLCVGNKIYTKKEIDFHEIFFSSQFIMAVIYGILFFILFMIRFNPIQTSKYIILTSTLIVSYSLINKIHSINDYKIKLKKNKLQKTVTLIVILLILFSISISIFSVYKVGNHLTHSEIEGTEWHIRHSDLEKETISGEMSYKMIYFLRGRNVSEEKLEVFPRHTMYRFQQPHRLGYLENDTIAESIGEDVYLITMRYDYVFHERLTEGQEDREDTKYYLKEDIEKLENDLTANKLYTNGEYIVWKTS